jgi:hypothetical protein
LNKTTETIPAVVQPQSSQRIKPKLPNKKFLSTINKFELLSRGIRVEESDEQFDLNNSIKSNKANELTNKFNQELNIKNNNNKMICSSVSIEDTIEKMLSTSETKKNFIYFNKDLKSKSFGCEKDLHNSSSGNGSSSSSSSSSSTCSSTSSSSSSGMGRSWSTRISKSCSKTSKNNTDLILLKNKRNNKRNKKKVKKEPLPVKEVEIKYEEDAIVTNNTATTSATSLSIDLLPNDNSIVCNAVVPEAFHIDNLDFIDDDASLSLVCPTTTTLTSKNESLQTSINENQPKNELILLPNNNNNNNNELSDDDDYDDNVIYEGDSDSDNDSQLIDDIYGDTNLNDPITTTTTTNTTPVSIPETITPVHVYTRANNTNEENDDEIDTRSSKSEPITSPVKKINNNEIEKKNETNNSFIYDINLYTDNHSFTLLNQQDELNKFLEKQKSKNKKISNQDSSASDDALNKSKLCNFDSEDDNDDIVVETYLSNSCNSSTYSLNNYSIKLEPLLIEEDNKQDKKSTTSLSVSKETFEIRVDIVDTDSFNTTLPEAVPALPPQSTTEQQQQQQQQQQTTATNVTNENSTNTFSCSSLNTNSVSNLSSSLVVEPAQPQTINNNNNNNSDSNCLNRLDEAAASLNERLKCETNKYSEEDEINQRQNQNSTEDDSLVDVDCLPQSPQSALETTARSINNEIVKATVEEEEDDDEEDKSSSTISDLSNTKIKDNYEKAKRERQLEQEQAELEKKRLQEILDICMEFQRQEQSKTELSSSTTTANNKHRQNQNLNIRPPNLGSLKQIKSPGILAVHTKNDKKSVNKTNLNNQIEENGLSPSSSSSSSSTASDSSSSINTNKLLNVINNVDLYNCKNDKNKINKLRSVSNGPFVLSNSIKNGNNGINSNSDVINKFFLLFFLILL